jgi:hypothetical protein
MITRPMKKLVAADKKEVTAIGKEFVAAGKRFTISGKNYGCRKRLTAGGKDFSNMGNMSQPLERNDSCGVEVTWLMRWRPGSDVATARKRCCSRRNYSRRDCSCRSCSYRKRFDGGREKFTATGKWRIRLWLVNGMAAAENEMAAVEDEVAIAGE